MRQDRPDEVFSGWGHHPQDSRAPGHVFWGRVWGVPGEARPTITGSRPMPRSFGLTPAKAGRYDFAAFEADFGRHHVPDLQSIATHFGRWRSVKLRKASSYPFRLPFFNYQKNIYINIFDYPKHGFFNFFVRTILMTTSLSLFALISRVFDKA
jgi:hypothetical protein